MTTAQDPERIWLSPKCEDNSYEGRTWGEQRHDCEDCDEKAVAYIRLDVAIAGGYKPKSKSEEQ